MSRWQGKVAIITGASSGNGAAIAENFVKNGLIVAGIARRKEKIEELAKKLEKGPGKLYAIQTDVTKEDDILKAFKWVKENLGPIHILINNAGVIKIDSLINGVTEHWRQTYETNILAINITTREAIKDMRANNVDGHIVHVNSIVGHSVPNVVGLNMYPSTKYAVTALTESVRQELAQMGSKIKISSISPGVVKTELFDSGNVFSNTNFQKLIESVPKLNPEDVADAIWYIIGTPPHVQVHDLILKPVGEPF